jgi:cell wall-associated NlpC family hydrolase
MGDSTINSLPALPETPVKIQLAPPQIATPKLNLPELKLATPAQLQASKRLGDMIPSLKHTVQAGETLMGIANKYSSSRPADMELLAWVQTIQMTNGLGDGGLIKPGQVLKIPQLVITGEKLETTARPEGPYDPAAGVTFPAAASSAGKIGNTVGKAATTPQSQETVPAKPKEPVWREEIVTAARDTLGTRYVWGGTNLDKGVDCSGLTQGLFDQMGVDLPRTSGEQFKAGGKPVERKDLQAGDLVFFRNTKGKIVHVGVYTGKDDKGRQMYISATNSKGVAEVAIDDWTRWNKSQRYAGARRFEVAAGGQ